MGRGKVTTEIGRGTRTPCWVSKNGTPMLHVPKPHIQLRRLLSGFANSILVPSSRFSCN